MGTLDNWQFRSVDDFPGVAGRLGRQRFMANNSRALALGSFAVVLFLVVRIGGNSANRLWMLPVLTVLVLGIAVNVYSLLIRFRVLGVRCPRCTQRFGTATRCNKCGLPQHGTAPEVLNY